MESGDWITLGAVIVALGIGVASLVQTKRLQKRERKERLLNEIIEWAIEVSNCGQVAKYAETKNETEYVIVTASDLDAFNSLENRGRYISKISLKLEQDLGNAVAEVMSIINERKLLLVKSMPHGSLACSEEVRKALDILSGKTKMSDDISQATKITVALGNNATALNKSINKVIEKASEIKTKDIS